MATFIACFLPIFIAIDAIGILPNFMNLTSDYSRIQRNKIVNHASLTAFCVGILFIFVGKTLFKFLGISMSDFQIAGGILLFTFSLRDLLGANKSRRTIKDPHIGIVPIGMPLIAGPGVLTALMVLVGKYGSWLPLISFAINIFICFICFRYSDFVIKILGRAGAIAIGKVFAIFLGAIGIMLIRRGIMDIVQQAGLAG